MYNVYYLKISSDHINIVLRILPVTYFSIINLYLLREYQL